MPANQDWKGVVEPGIRKYAGPNGERWYRVQIGRRGKGQRASRICKTLEAAAALKKQWTEQGIERPDDPPAPGTDAATETVGDLMDVYLAERPNNAEGAKSTTAVIGRVYPALLELPVQAVTAEHFEIWLRSYVADGCKASGAGTHFCTFLAALHLRRPDFRLPKDVWPDKAPPRHPMLTDKEAKRAWIATPEPFRSMARLASITAMRLTEVRTLRREAVDFATRTITLERAKAGPRTVALGREAVALLERQLASHPHAYVFPRDPGRGRAGGRHAGQPYSRRYVWEIWVKTTREILGRRNFTFHDLRHHAAMTALANGATFPELMQLGGWARTDMVMRYAVASADRVRELQDRGARGHGVRRHHARPR